MVKAWVNYKDGTEKTILCDKVVQTINIVSFLYEDGSAERVNLDTIDFYGVWSNE